MLVNRRISIKSKGNCDVIDITESVAEEVSGSGLRSGTVAVFVSGSTAGVTTIEYEPGLIDDMQNMWRRLVPEEYPYKHNESRGEDNGYSHIRASMLGASLVVPFVDKALSLGTWQQIIVVDFDTRPRSREVVLQIMGE